MAARTTRRACPPRCTARWTLWRRRVRAWVVRQLCRRVGCDQCAGNPGALLAGRSEGKVARRLARQDRFRTSCSAGLGLDKQELGGLLLGVPDRPLLANAMRSARWPAVALVLTRHQPPLLPTPRSACPACCLPPSCCSGGGSAGHCSWGCARCLPGAAVSGGRTQSVWIRDQHTVRQRGQPRGQWWQLFCTGFRTG